MTSLTWSKNFLKIVYSTIHKFDKSKNFKNFKISGQLVGKLDEATIDHFKRNFPNYFSFSSSEVSLLVSPDHGDQNDPKGQKIFSKTSQILNEIANHDESKKIIKHKFRFEQYAIFQLKSQKVLSQLSPKDFLNWEILGCVERSACPLFGVTTIGTHMTIYREAKNQSKKSSKKSSEIEIEILVAKRSETKSKYPGYYDNSVAGGLALPEFNEIGSFVETGEQMFWPMVENDKSCPLLLNMQKEAEEEAGIIDGNILKNIKYIGNTTYLYATNYYGPRIQFNYKLKVDHNFKPVPTDGEVANFMWCNVDEIYKLMSGDKFKSNSMVCLLDFLIKEEILNRENCLDFDDILATLRV